jgi:hypothetical protein
MLPDNVYSKQLTAMARWVFAGLCTLIAWALVCSAAGRARRTTLELLYSIPVPGEFVAVLEDVSPEGIAILNGTGGNYGGRTLPSPDYDRPKLLLWNVRERKLLREVPLGECVKRRAKLPPELRALRLGPFRFADDNKGIIGLQLPWLFAVDPSTDIETARFLLSPGLLKGASPAFPDLAQPLAISPNGAVLAAVADQGGMGNEGVRPRLALLRSDLKAIINYVPLDHYVIGLAWSQDSARIAVLYAVLLDENGRFIPSRWAKGSPISMQPDIEIFDAQSGKSVLRFRTGVMEAEISFSHDGSALWCIAGRASDTGWGGDVIRVFSSTDGSLTRTIRGGREGLRGDFVISPTGRFVVADSSRIVPYIIREPPTDQKIGRFTFLDAATGDVLFKYQKRMTGDYGASYRFAFTEDERFLLVDPNNFHSGPGPRLEERVDVYAID